jgi:hypothetical protein
MALGGKNSTWKHKLTGNATMTDFSEKTMSVSLNAEAEQVESTTFGDSYRNYEQSFKNATVEVMYKYDATIYGQLAAIYNAGDIVDFELYPDGAANATDPKITGKIFITSFGTPVEIGNLLQMSVTFQVDGALTFTVVTP